MSSRSKHISRSRFGSAFEAALRFGRSFGHEMVDLVWRAYEVHTESTQETIMTSNSALTVSRPRFEAPTVAEVALYAVLVMLEVSVVQMF